MKLSDQIHRILRNHVGLGQAIGAAEIARRVGTHERAVREIIAEHAPSWPDCIICAAQAGYFNAEHYDEVEAYDAHLSGLAKAATDKHAAFRASLKARGVHVPTP